MTKFFIIILLALGCRNLFLDKKPNQSRQVVDGFQEYQKSDVRLFTGKDKNNNFHQLYCFLRVRNFHRVKGLRVYSERLTDVSKK